jgi:hypothetical protein
VYEAFSYLRKLLVYEAFSYEPVSCGQRLLWAVVKLARLVPKAN